MGSKVSYPPPNRWCYSPLRPLCVLSYNVFIVGQSYILKSRYVERLQIGICMNCSFDYCRQLAHKNGKIVFVSTVLTLSYSYESSTSEFRFLTVFKSWWLFVHRKLYQDMI